MQRDGKELTNVEVAFMAGELFNSQLTNCHERGDWDNAAATARQLATVYDELAAMKRA
ncbi:MAG TPA: hypothetical protein VHV29_10310 [Terriglobales bacterium]|jgi:hypothetical protein|nr:hypothetical protein [Terriglobales bacterium]